MHLGGAGDGLDGDRASAVAEVQRAGLGEVDGAEVGLERDGAERAFGLEVAEAGLAADGGAGGQLDQQVDGLRALAAEVDEPAAGLAGGDAERAGGVVVLNPGVLGGLDVGGLARVAGADLDDGVGAVGNGEADVGDVEVEGDGDGGRGVEVRAGHLGFLVLGEFHGSNMAPLWHLCKSFWLTMAYTQLTSDAMVCEDGTKRHHLRPAASRDAARRSSTPSARQPRR